MKYLLLVISMMFLASCEPIVKTSKTTEVNKVVVKENVINSAAFIKGKRNLEIQGYSNVIETSYPWFCCSESDSFFFSTGFKATGPDGEIVTGCICTKTNLFRNSVTIRFE